jgi:hypothetical protein
MFPDIGLALVGVDGPKYYVHIFQTAAFSLREEPSNVN